MPMHDWSKVNSGLYHALHFNWTGAITAKLNGGVLPPGYFAIPEQIIGRYQADVANIRQGSPNSQSSGVAPAPVRPRATVVQTSLEDRYAQRTHRVAIHHGLGEVVAVIEIVSPVNKEGARGIRTFVEKCVDLIYQGVNVLVIDPIPPGSRDPNGIHPLIWTEICDTPYQQPPDRPLTVVSYQVAPIKTAYIEPMSVGQPVPDGALFLFEDEFVTIPLEETYLTAWNGLPAEIRPLVEARRSERS